MTADPLEDYKKPLSTDLKTTLGFSNFSTRKFFSIKHTKEGHYTALAFSG